MNDSAISGTKRYNQENNEPSNDLESCNSPSFTNKRLKTDSSVEARTNPLSTDNEQHDVHPEAIQTPSVNASTSNLASDASENDETTTSGLESLVQPTHVIDASVDSGKPQLSAGSISNETSTVSCAASPTTETPSNSIKAETGLARSMTTSAAKEIPRDQIPGSQETILVTRDSAATTASDATLKHSTRDLPSLNSLISSKSAYSPYEGQGMRMSVSAILSESGRGSFHRETQGKHYSPVSNSMLPTKKKSPSMLRGQSMPPSLLSDQSTDTIAKHASPSATMHSRSASQPSNIVPEKIKTESKSFHTVKTEDESVSATKNSLTKEQLVHALTSVPSTNVKEESYGSPTWGQSLAHREPQPASTAAAPNISSNRKTSNLNRNPASAADTQHKDMSKPLSDAPQKLNAISSSTSSGNKSSVQMMSLGNINSLPSVNAALRRLSGTPGIEESKIPQLTAALIESSSAISRNNPKLTRGDVKREDHASPSEILGNALAVVAANAGAGRSNASSSDTTAAVIGNIAANITNILHGRSGFTATHRGNFSQEDNPSLSNALQLTGVQKAKGTNGSGSTLSSILDQAFFLGTRASEDGHRQDAKGHGNHKVLDGIGKPTVSPGAIASGTNKGTVAGKKQNGRSQQINVVNTEEKKPQLIINNEQVWRAVEGIEEKSLGFYLYQPDELLPNMSGHINGIFEVRVPARYLSYGNKHIQKRAIWGTDIYTDDSDVVAMAIHSGKYQLPFSEPEVQPDSPFALAIAGKSLEAARAAKSLAISGKMWQKRENSGPGYDLKLTIRVLPKLRSYASTIRHNIKSRPWGNNHDGVSFYVEKAEKIKKGDARLRGRDMLKAEIMAYEPYRKRALGLRQQKEMKQRGEPLEMRGPDCPAISISRARMKKTQRVIRLFQMRSELLQNKQ
ncbi:hypothetical protein EC973_003760 [Apophysomyces ossiformis]|uniref:Histone deacetylation protein Rxt3 n=1 Tax=Apophysomyces ossiformis TaxID=679940 RepID=A0A8H7EQC8_9FUNG|nr:hypothetical protein EC973_003760 [Apophysomyces ossiformis]